MQRRQFIRNSIGLGILSSPLLGRWNSAGSQQSAPTPDSAFSGLSKPVFVYNNWSSYDELSDNVAQTETLAMRQLSEIIRLKARGVRIDYYVMDAFWFDQQGGYRTWHREHWPQGPGAWLRGCHDQDIRPGMWFSTNLVRMGGRQALDVIPQWRDSQATDPNILCLYTGGYLPHLRETLQSWYDQGVRLFKFDFAYFEAVSPPDKDRFSPEEIREKNKQAFREMLIDMRSKNKDIIITGYNGFGGEMENTFTPFRKTVDPRWLDAFDTLYCGDPRFSDVPMINIWRSQDNYSDHMVRQFAFNDIPVRRIDNCAFMIGKTGTCYYRANHCWKGMLILELARGGWMNVYHGNLELLTEEDAAWFARTQSMYADLQGQDRCSSLGAIPGSGKPYGFAAAGARGDLFALVNPSQQTVEFRLPDHKGLARLLYADGGYVPTLNGHGITLGPEQLVLVGCGGYASPQFDLGTDPTIQIPRQVQRIEVAFSPKGTNRIEGTIQASPSHPIRIFFQQFEKTGLPRRSWGGAPPTGKKMDQLLKIRVHQDGKELPAHLQYDKMIWSGLSWAAVEIRKEDIQEGKPLFIECSSEETDPLQLKAEVYEIRYEA